MIHLKDILRIQFPRFGSLLKKKYYQKKFPEEKNDLIDVYITTYKRPKHFKNSLELLLASCNSSNFRHRVTVICDKVNEVFFNIIKPYRCKINILTCELNLGLPFSFNLLLSHNRLLVQRSNEKAKYLCYIQDDCIIKDTTNFFNILDKIYSEAAIDHNLGFISGYYTPIHPGFSKTTLLNQTVLLSDSIDGKHIMGKPDVFQSIGELSDFLPNGSLRGNPGPIHGSHFDLWQWKESPNSTMKQKLINLIVPGLIETSANNALESTWNNPSDQKDHIQKRIAKGQIYNTRRTYPILSSTDFYNS